MDHLLGHDIWPNALRCCTHTKLKRKKSERENKRLKIKHLKKSHWNERKKRKKKKKRWLFLYELIWLYWRGEFQYLSFLSMQWNTFLMTTIYFSTNYRLIEFFPFKHCFECCFLLFTWAVWNNICLSFTEHMTMPLRWRCSPCCSIARMYFIL